jgi:8-oxo-dGTP pyrophosphatase MutT (NUDIX family)
MGVLESWDGPVADSVEPAHLLRSETVHVGGKWRVDVETVEISGQQVKRDIVIHPGAVAVLVLNERDEVLLIRQYRQALGMFLFETPAGLLDIPDENPLTAAQRELAEEAGVSAARWDTLVDFYNSPGGSSEAIRIYLARELTELPLGRIVTGEAEEADLPTVWVPLSGAVDLVFSGRLGNPTAVLGILAAWTWRTGPERILREANSAWRAREGLEAVGRLPAV